MLCDTINDNEIKTANASVSKKPLNRMEDALAVLFCPLAIAVMGEIAMAIPVAATCGMTITLSARDDAASCL